MYVDYLAQKKNQDEKFNDNRHSVLRTAPLQLRVGWGVAGQSPSASENQLWSSQDTTSQYPKSISAVAGHAACNFKVSRTV